MGFVRDTVNSFTGRNQADAAKEGAKAQGAATEKGIDATQAAQAQMRTDLQPFTSLGNSNILGLQKTVDNQDFSTPGINPQQYLNYNPQSSANPLQYQNYSNSIDPNSAFNPNDPQLNFLINKGNSAINENAAARGLLNSGGTQAALQENAIGTAGQFSNQRFNQLMAQNQDAQNVNQMNFGNTFSNNQNLFNQNAANGSQASSLLDQFFREKLATQNNAYNQRMNIVNLGQNSAAMVGQSGVNTAGNISNLLGQGANAYAAGQVGAANAIGQGTKNIMSLGSYFFGKPG